MRRNAGSKSKVSIILYGDEQDSEARALEDPDRNPFQRGSQDTFLLTTPFDLGSIQYIRIWHDNTGGSLFLSRIMVIDLQTDERYYFICNRWLAVDEEDGQVRIWPRTFIIIIIHYCSSLLTLQYLLLTTHYLKVRYYIATLPHFIKQLLDEVEHDIMNYQNRGLCYNTDTRF